MEFTHFSNKQTITKRKYTKMKVNTSRNIKHTRGNNSEVQHTYPGTETTRTCNKTQQFGIIPILQRSTSFQVFPVLLHIYSNKHNYFINIHFTPKPLS